MTQRRSNRNAKGTKASKLPAARKANGTVTHGDKLAHAAASKHGPEKSLNAAAGKTANPGARKTGGKAMAKPAAAEAKVPEPPSGFFARAKTAVGNVVKRVTAKRSPATQADASVDQRKAKKNTA